jgi:hypothetical protein
MNSLKYNAYNTIILLFYGSLLFTGLLHHELWGDELHSWNIAKGSETLAQLFHNIRYEGHPPFWYLCLFAITRFTHALVWLKILQGCFAIATALIIIFKSPFTLLQKVLILCGYYFVFEYAVISRNYMPAIFLACCIAAFCNSRTRLNTAVYYVLLLLLSNVHLVGLILAVSIHVSVCHEDFRSGNKSVTKILSGFLIFLPSAYFIFPPYDSQLNIAFWKEHWNATQLYLFVTVIVKSFFPFPVFENKHWWNTNFFLDNNSVLFRMISLVIFFLVLSITISSIRKSKNALVFFLVNLSLTCLLSFVFPLNSARYVGFVFISYLISIWIARKENAEINSYFCLLILFLQIPAGAFAFVNDYKQKFSTAENVIQVWQKEIINPGDLVATDYWTLNNLSAYVDSSFYTLELKRQASYLLWNNEMKAALQFDYGRGLLQLLKINRGNPYYFFSMKNPEQAVSWSDFVTVKLVFFSGKAIEPSGEIYLYRVEMIE